MKGPINQIAICIVAATSLLAASCSAEYPNGGTLPNGEREISLTTAIDGDLKLDANPAGASTRAAVSVGPLVDGAAVDAKAALSNMTFFRKNGTSMQTNFSSCPTLTAQRTNTGAISFYTPQQYSKDNQNAYFVGFWPGLNDVNTSLSAGNIIWKAYGHQDIIISTLNSAQSYDAGKYSSASTGGSMQFHHLLAHLQITCKADANTSVDVTKAVWGDITKIELPDCPIYAYYDLATNAVSYGAGALSLCLWTPGCLAEFKNQTYSLSKIPAGIAAEGMYIPTTGVLKLKVYTTKVTEGRTVEVQLKDGSSNSKNFERGMTHQVTLTFGANPKEIGAITTGINPWENGGNHTTDEVLPPPSTVLVVGQEPHAVVGGTINGASFTTRAATTTSYNNLAQNPSSDYLYSSYEGIFNSSTGEQPFFRFEVSKADESAEGLLWNDAWTACKNKAPAGKWRLPRAAELALLYWNRATLEATDDFVQFTNTHYWSGTTSPGAGSTWYVKFDTALLGYLGIGSSLRVRCVREIP